MFENTTPTRYVYRVHGVGRVTVEIGDVVRREGDVGRFDHRHSYPEYRVAIDGNLIMEGSDLGIPAGKSTDDRDSALSLLFWAAYEESKRDDERFDAESLDLWVSDRQTVRDALRAPVRDTDPRAVVRAAYAGEL